MANKKWVSYSHRTATTVLSLLPSGPGEIQRELVVEDLPETKIAEKSGFSKNDTDFSWKTRKTIFLCKKAEKFAMSIFFIFALRNLETNFGPRF